MFDPNLFMVRLPADRRRLLEFCRAQRFPLQHVDLGYSVHYALRSVFADAAPQPFTIEAKQGREFSVLGYTTINARSLLERASEIADPLAFTVFDLERTVDKPMPTQWRVGRELGFQLRACPVVRKASAGNHHRAGAEVDVYLSRCWQADDSNPPNRESTYIEWLRQQFAPRGAELVTACVRRFQLEKLSRRVSAQPRTWAFVARPDVLFQGRLRVSNAQEFGQLLRRGIGRHRAFAYGMVLLRP